MTALTEPIELVGLPCASCGRATRSLTIAGHRHIVRHLHDRSGNDACVLLDPPPRAVDLDYRLTGACPAGHDRAIHTYIHLTTGCLVCRPCRNAQRRPPQTARKAQATS